MLRPRAVVTAIIIAAAALVAAAPPALAAPDNDDRSAAEVISGLPFRDQVATLDATTDPDDPQATGPQCSGTEDATVWYRYTAPGDGAVTIDTAGTDYDTAIAVFAESPQGLSQIECTTYFNGARNARATFHVAAGTSYLVMIGAVRGEGGSLLLSVDPASAEPLTVNVTVDATARSLPQTGGVALTGTVTCSRSATVRLTGEVVQGDARSAVSSRPLVCSASGPTSWAARSSASDEALRHGPASVTLAAVAVDSQDHAEDALSAELRIRAPRLVFARSTGPGDNPFASEIFTMAEDGSRVRRLTDNDVEDTHPAFSPDGRRIAFVRGHRTSANLYVMRADGSRVRRLTTAPHVDSAPDWSPDGKWLVFSRHFVRSRQSDLYKIRVDDGALRRLTRTAARELTPDWSPDGALLAFARHVDHRAEYGIAVIRSAGGGLRWLTRNPRSRGGHPDTTPSWSPGATHVAFTREAADFSIDVFTVRRDGTRVRRLTDLATAQAPAWGPDGRLAMMHNSGIAVIERDGTGLRRLRQAGDDDGRPHWWPDWAQATGPE